LTTDDDRPRWKKGRTLEWSRHAAAADAVRIGGRAAAQKLEYSYRVRLVSRLTSRSRPAKQESRIGVARPRAVYWLRVDDVAVMRRPSITTPRRRRRERHAEEDLPNKICDRSATKRRFLE